MSRMLSRGVCAVMSLAAANVANAAMPVAEQNALVQKYCAVCHTDAARNGGLSLEHYDASRRDPGLAAMMLSKLSNGAMGAAGAGVPDKAAQEAWLRSTMEQAAGAREWFVTREGGSITAGIVRDVAPRKPGSTDVPVYRLLLACNGLTGKGEMQLTWSPEPKTGQTMMVSMDGSAPVGHRVEGEESMGNGQAGKAGRASAVLSEGRGGKLGLPAKTLTVRELFPGETVEFPMAGLEKKAREELGQCFTVDGR